MISDEYSFLLTSFYCRALLGVAIYTLPMGLLLRSFCCRRFLYKKDFSLLDTFVESFVLGLCPLSVLMLILFGTPNGFQKFASMSNTCMIILTCILTLQVFRIKPRLRITPQGLLLGSLLMLPVMLLTYVSPSMFDCAQLSGYQDLIYGKSYLDLPMPGFFLRFGWVYISVILASSFLAENYLLLNTGVVLGFFACLILLAAFFRLSRQFFSQESVPANVGVAFLILLFQGSMLFSLLGSGKATVFSMALFVSGVSYCVEYLRDPKCTYPAWMSALMFSVALQAGLSGAFFGFALLCLLLLTRYRGSAALILFFAFLISSFWLLPIKSIQGLLPWSISGAAVIFSAGLLLTLRFQPLRSRLATVMAQSSKRYVISSIVLVWLSLVLSIPVLMIPYDDSVWHNGKFSWYGTDFYHVYVLGYGFLIVGMVLTILSRTHSVVLDVLRLLLSETLLLPSVVVLLGKRALIPEFLRTGPLLFLSQNSPSTILDFARSLHLYFIPIVLILTLAYFMCRACISARRKTLAGYFVVLSILLLISLFQEDFIPQPDPTLSAAGWNYARNKSLSVRVDEFRAGSARVAIYRPIKIPQLSRVDNPRRVVLGLWDREDENALGDFLLNSAIARGIKTYFAIPDGKKVLWKDPTAQGFFGWWRFGFVTGFDSYLVKNCTEASTALNNGKQIFIVSHADTAIPKLKRLFIKKIGPYTVSRLSPGDDLSVFCPGQE